MLSVYSHTRTSPGASHAYDEGPPRSTDSDRVDQHVACRLEQPLLNQWRARVCRLLRFARCKPPRRLSPICAELYCTVDSLRFSERLSARPRDLQKARLRGFCRKAITTFGPLQCPADSCHAQQAFLVGIVLSVDSAGPQHCVAVFPQALTSVGSFASSP